MYIHFQIVLRQRFKVGQNLHALMLCVAKNRNHMGTQSESWSCVQSLFFVPAFETNDLLLLT